MVPYDLDNSHTACYSPTSTPTGPYSVSLMDDSPWITTFQDKINRYSAESKAYFSDEEAQVDVTFVPARGVVELSISSAKECVRQDIQMRFLLGAIVASGVFILYIMGFIFKAKLSRKGEIYTVSQPLGRVSVRSLCIGAPYAWIKVAATFSILMEFIQLLSAFVLISPEFVDNAHKYSRLEFATCSLPNYAPVRDLLLFMGLNFHDVFTFQIGYAVVLGLNFGFVFINVCIIPSEKVFPQWFRRHCLDVQKVSFLDILFLPSLRAALSAFHCNYTKFGRTLENPLEVSLFLDDGTVCWSKGVTVHTVFVGISALWTTVLIIHALYLSKQVWLDYIERRMPENFHHGRIRDRNGKKGKNTKKRAKKRASNRGKQGEKKPKKDLQWKKQETEDGNETNDDNGDTDQEVGKQKNGSILVKNVKLSNPKTTNDSTKDDGVMKPKHVDINYLIAPMVPRIQTIFTGGKIVLCFAQIVLDKHHVIFQLLLLFIVGVWIVLNHKYQPLLGDNAVPNTVRTCGLVVLFLSVLTSMASMMVHHQYSVRGNDELLLEFERDQCSNPNLHIAISLTWFANLIMCLILVPITWVLGYRRAQGVLDYLDWKKVVWNGKEKRRTVGVLGNVKTLMSLFHFSEANMLGIVFALDSVIPLKFHRWDPHTLTIIDKETEAYKYERLVAAAVATKRDIMSWALSQSEHPSRSITDAVIARLRGCLTLACGPRTVKRQKVYVVDDDADIQQIEPAEFGHMHKVSKEHSHPTWYGTSRSLLTGATFLDLSCRGLTGETSVHFWHNLLLHSFASSLPTNAIKRHNGWITTHVDLRDNAIREPRHLLKLVSLCAQHLPELRHLDISGNLQRGKVKDIIRPILLQEYCASNSSGQNSGLSHFRVIVIARADADVKQSQQRTSSFFPVLKKGQALLIHRTTETNSGHHERCRSL